MKYESHAGIYYSFIHEMAKLSTDLCSCNNVESFHLRKPETPNYSQKGLPCFRCVHNITHCLTSLNIKQNIRIKY